jgi:superfamily II DNA or RNA helicase
MGLRDLDTKSVYKSSEDDVLMDFYVPCLSSATRYDRLAGFFSSSSFSVAAEGLLSFIGRSGKMRLVCSPELQTADIDVLQKSPDELRRLCGEKIAQAVENADSLELQRDHLAVLAYMLAHGLLEIRIAVPLDSRGQPSSTPAARASGIFHEKVGLFYDSDGNAVSFSGSINESANAWLWNAEEFKVFRSWELEQRNYQSADIQHFADLWDGRSHSVAVFSLPEAAERRMLQAAPDTLDIPGLRAKYELRRTIQVRDASESPTLYQYQIDAVNAWLDHDRRGILEMATGTGKTYTALACVRATMPSNRGILCVIAAPQQHLLDQWASNTKAFFPDVVPVLAHSGNTAWRPQLSQSISRLLHRGQGLAIVLATHATAASSEFTVLVKRAESHCSCLLVGDEAHRLGATTYSRALLDAFTWRLGLSATPTRWMDDVGSHAVLQFFGPSVYEFPLREAILTTNPSTHRTYLVPYDYYPRYAVLTHAETIRYASVCKQISRLCAIGEDTRNPSRLERLYFERARILKNAQNKLETFENILDEIGREKRHIIVYCTEVQMSSVCATLAQRRMTFHPFTMAQGTRRDARFGGQTERRHLLQEFRDGVFQVLAAIRCLDEGVDIPEARVAVLLASSSSPVEHIQRLGRILRPCEGKESAVVFDVMARRDPQFGSPGDSFVESLERIELSRIREIASWARNEAEALKSVYLSI